MPTIAEIIGSMLAPDADGLEPSTAKAILQLRFSESATERIRELMDKNSGGGILAEEREELDAYVRAGQAVDLWKARANRVMNRRKELEERDCSQ